jgi:ribosome-binding protein aMBF1 (putative translation factor)
MGSLGARLFGSAFLERCRSINRNKEIFSGISSVARLLRKRNHPAVRDLSDSVARSFGEKLRAARVKARLSQEELAYRGGVNRTLVGQLELGRHSPRLDTVIKLAGALGIEPCQLIADVRWEPPADGPPGGEFRRV